MLLGHHDVNVGLLCSTCWSAWHLAIRSKWPCVALWAWILCFSESDCCHIRHKGCWKGLLWSFWAEQSGKYSAFRAPHCSFWGSNATSVSAWAQDKCCVWWHLVSPAHFVTLFAMIWLDGMDFFLGWNVFTKLQLNVSLCQISVPYGNIKC